MPKYEITIKEIPEDNEGCAILLIIIVAVAIYLFGDGSTSDKVEYWNGDKNCPIFTKRNDGSMVVFKKDSAREIDRYYSNGDKLFVFQGYEVEPDGYFEMYGYYGVLYNKSQKQYEVIYPKTANFPGGERFSVKNSYQRAVLDVMIDSSSKYDKLKWDK